MFERESGSKLDVNQRLRREVATLKEINSKGRVLLKVGVGLAILYAADKLIRGEKAEAAAASVVSGIGLLVLTEDPLAWKIGYKEAQVENSEPPLLIKS
jgi:hypothetical protein